MRLIKCHKIKDIFRNLEGRWSIKRTLGGFGTAEGVANFVQLSNDRNVLSYAEKLEITFYDEGKQIGEKQAGYQKYTFKYDDTQDSISKYNASEHFMYKLKFSKDRASGVYLCDQDKYIATYVLGDKRFALTYEVIGADKDYSIITIFTKIEDEVRGAS